MNTEQMIIRLISFFVPFLFALCFHELAHGLVAKWKGDNTASMMGRLTMNPLPHMDFIGTFLLPVITIVTGSSLFFGWAKPVPVNERNLKNPRVDMFWIALAGPASNVLLAIVATVVLWAQVHFFAAAMDAATFKAVLNLIVTFISINLFLAVFNLIPVNPLDGGKVLARFLPTSLNNKLEENQQIISIVLFMLLLSGAMRFLQIPVLFMTEGLLRAAGLT